MIAGRVGAAWPRRIPAGMKLAFLALSSATLFFTDSLYVLGCAFLATLVLTGAAGGLRLLRGLYPIAAMLLFAFLAHLLLGDWHTGAAVFLRIAALVVLATLVSASTEISEMLSVMDWLLAPLRWLGLPTRPASIACVLTLRFAPMLAERWRMLGAAWRARSPRRPGWRLVVPFVLSALDDADGAATALLARGAFRRK